MAARNITFRDIQVVIGRLLPTKHNGNRKLAAECATIQALLGLDLPANGTNYRLSMSTPPGPGGNDRVGCCPFAAERVIYMERGASIGDEPNIVVADELARYARVSGWNGVVGDQSDTGTTVDAMVADAEANGIDGFTFTGQASIRSGNIDMIRRVVAFFVGGVNFGFQLPDAVLNQPMPTTPEGRIVWDVCGPANPDNGHDVMGLDVAPNGNIIIDTWGFTDVEVTPAFILAYADDVRAVETSNGFDVNGKNAAGLTREQTSLAA
jgi:hypothetical protein